ncbi:2-polyprenyl-6-methoxyphenol hydroxylase-like FAD-dependent oxidoreductase [Hamadaea flava]|uniref:FAD-dependent oxidoreductase n=1 Tax=Hamadaea flava TaxID=1742688 RepID=A0ABV8M275_9ACTN|nr:NAD(P)/FAD-dependent oxidoreductase [Hamadaea flava]MCP2324473.1 2-polyprenyl-6-methoxyphenol hydroxylase-like FAD-dependent oxidoreductase [Hamadaea flava]
MKQTVMIIGGGIGGLALAHGLRRAGIPVAVYERSQTRTEWLQGYRIHINPHGSRALHECLEPAAWQAFLDTVSTGDGGFGFTTERFVNLLHISHEDLAVSPDPAEQHYGVSRISLRQVLLSGLDDVLHLGKTFTRYDTTPDGRVTAYFEDGSSATGDLLVGADGANSRVRRQLLPHADRIDTGVTAVAGKHRLTESALARLPQQLTRDANLVIPAGRGNLFTAVWRHDRATVAPDANLPEGFLLDNTADYTFWAYADASAQFPSDVDGYDGEALTRLILDRTPDWSAELRDLIGGSDPATVNVVRIRSATPVDPWPTGPVTLLGDAIHNMTPMAGIGANTALRDADLLRRQLIAVESGLLSQAAAVAEYERQMRDYGFAAVKQSLRNARQAASANRFGRTMFRTVLWTMSAVPPLKRRFARSFGS